MASNGSPKTSEHGTKSNNPNHVIGSENQGEATKRPRPRKKGPNYNQIHSKPLPLEIQPLPAFHPTNPLSLLRLAYAYLWQLFASPSSHPQVFTGYFSSDTRSVHITDPKQIRALWEMGFWGKGTLSRSEPSWIEREKAQLQVRRTGGRTAEEATNARREERRLFKLERARAEREKIERQRLVEAGQLDAMEVETQIEDASADSPVNGEVSMAGNGHVVVPSETPIHPTSPEGRIPDAVLGKAMPNPASQPAEVPSTVTMNEEDEVLLEIENQEHLQLTLEEAFLLSYGLGILHVRPSANSPDEQTPTSLSNPELMQLFCQHSFFPPRAPSISLAPDDPFLLNYVVYHHFRSLGWVVRSGIKFSVDYLLYNRGPVFAHAEFAVIIWPAYAHPAWTTAAGQARRRVPAERDWWWLHCVNRVQSQVRKSLVLVYVDVPPDIGERGFDGDVGALLGRYRVREFMVKRWLANRSRD